MPKQVVWSPQSKKDFSDILNFLRENWGKSVSVKFIDVIDELLYQIAINPKQFPIIQKKNKIRKCVITRHNSLDYQKRKGYVAVLRMYDNRQDPQRLKFS